MDKKTEVPCFCSARLKGVTATRRRSDGKETKRSTRLSSKPVRQRSRRHAHENINPPPTHSSMLVCYPPSFGHVPSTTLNGGGGGGSPRQRCLNISVRRFDFNVHVRSRIGWPASNTSDGKSKRSKGKPNMQQHPCLITTYMS